MKHIVYKTINTVNNKYYIGVHSTLDINDSYLGCGHWKGRKIYTNTTSPILNAFLKYGDTNFKREILFIFDNREEALLKEQEIINIRDTNSYNAREGGNNNYIYTTEAKDKMSKSAKIRSQKILLQTVLLKEHVKNRIGKTYTEIYGEEKAKEIRLKRSKSLTGRKLTNEHKRKMSENRKGKDSGKCKGKKQVWNTLTNKTIRLSESELHTEIKRGIVIEKEFIKDKFHKFKFVKIK
jgi:hypothetical protein